MIERLKIKEKLIKKSDSFKVHIEEIQPYFLFTFTKSENFERLLYGFSSYGIFFEENYKILDEIKNVINEKYKNSLFIELVENKNQLHDIEISQNKFGDVVEIIDLIEDSLKEIKVRGKNLDVKVYKTKKGKFLSNANHIKIFIKPFYMEDGKFFPYVFRNFHHKLSVVLKKAIYEYSIRYTDYKPKHYFSIGKRLFNKAIWNIDKKLSSFEDEFDFLILLTPVNVEKAWEDFKKSNYEKNPDFIYRPKHFEVSEFKKKLYNIPIEKVEDPVIYDIFTKKRQEIDIKLSLIEYRNTKKFLHESIVLYSTPDKELLKEAVKILKMNLKEYKEEENITPDKLKKMALDEINYYKKQNKKFNPKVSIRGDIISKAMVSNGNLYIYKYTKFSKVNAISILNHEIGTHILTYFNGKKQKFSLLHTGLDGYEEMQEGLAVLSEYLSDSLTFFRIKLLAGRVVACDMVSKGADFVETFKELLNYNFEEKTAFTITTRVFRGGGLLKDYIYFKGLLKLLKILPKIKNIEILYTGKFSFHHIPIIEELIYRDIIKLPLIKPRYLENKEKLNKLKKGVGLKEIIDEISNGSK